MIVRAGVPSIMRARLEEVAPTLRAAPPVRSASIRADAKEGDLAIPLAAVQKAHPNVAIGSYPFVDGEGFNTNLVLRSRDPEALAAAEAAVEAMLSALR